MDRRGGITQIELEYMLHDEDAEPMALPFPLLEKITDYFSDKLEIGRGGFAVVYKAMLDNGTVAVKRLSNTYTHEEQFHREVECLMKVKHKNIVRFLGYCADTQGNIWDYKGKMVMADVQQRLLCFEYLPKGSLNGYITDSPRELDWRKRYDIIKGICEGLNYLHQNNILHFDLKPGNILLDEDMMPKITDFGLSRCFEEDQTRVITKNVVGTMGYLAPECYNKEIVLTHKFDLYSLGVIIIEILTGKNGYQVAIENVLEIWSNTMLDALQWEQIRLCAKIGIECTEVDPAKRPASMKHITDWLAEIECSTHVIPAGGTSELLLLHQFTLCFPFEPNKVITCPLQLTNNTDKHVAFRLMDKNTESSFLRLPLYGLVPPNTPYTLIVTTQEKEERPRKYIIDVILHCATLILGDDEHINTFLRKTNVFFQEMGNAVNVFLQEMGNAVHEVKLKAFFTLPRHVTKLSSKPISPTIKIICKVDFIHLYSFDINQDKQWIIIGEDKSYVSIWDYQTQRKVNALKVSATYGMISAVPCVKFIARKQWIVVVNQNSVHVYDYEKMQKITSFKVGILKSLAVHPTRPYLLSAGVNIMKLWDWDRGWECVQTFEYNKTAYKVAFITNDTFASASSDYTVEVWSLDSPKCNYILSGHSDKVKCLDFFTCHDQEFLVTGSDDQTAKIWYLQKKICIYTLEAFVSPVTSVLYQPNLQTLITGLEDGAIYLWSTTNFRIYSCPPMLKRIINIGCVGGVYHLACAMGRVVIGNENTVAIMDIDNVNHQEQSTDYSEQQLSADTRQHAGDTTSNELAGSISKLLGVRPQELRFPYHPNESIPCSLHLTNNTDKNVAFRLIDKSGKSPWCFTKLPLYGIVPRRSTYILIVKMKEEMKLEERTDFDLVIQSSLLGDKYMLFENQSESDQFFEEAKEFGNMVHEVTLEAVYVEYDGEITSEDQNISVKYNRDLLSCLDAHPTKPWILTGHLSGYVHAWNHEMKYPINSFKVSEKRVRSVKFIARWEWIVVVTNDGDIQVYDCACVTKIKKIWSVELCDTTNPPKLAVHPILPYVLVLRPYKCTMLFVDWKPTRTFSYIGFGPVAFIPGDNNRFVMESEKLDGKLEVWRLDSEDPEYSLLGHSKRVQSLDFIARGDKQYLISGSSDCTAKIWDLKKRECICTLEATSPVFCVLAHPKFPVLITGTLHGIIQMWSSTDFRLKRTINLGGGGPVDLLACLTGSPRIVIGQSNAISTMEILDKAIPKRRNFFPMRLRRRRKFTVAARGRRLRVNSQGALTMEL